MRTLKVLLVVAATSFLGACQFHCNDGFKPSGNVITGNDGGMAYRSCNMSCCGDEEGWSACRCSATCPCWKRSSHHASP